MGFLLSSVAKSSRLVTPYSISRRVHYNMKRLKVDWHSLYFKPLFSLGVRTDNQGQAIEADAATIPGNAKCAAATAVSNKDAANKVMAYDLRRRARERRRSRYFSKQYDCKLLWTASCNRSPAWFYVTVLSPGMLAQMVVRCPQFLRAE